MSAKLPFSYANPHLDVEPGIVRDPFIVKVGEMYYLTGTLRPIWAGPNPGVPLWSSLDLLNWQNLGLLIDRNNVPADAWYRDRWWAPEIHHAGDWFYLTVGCRNETTRHKHGVAIWRAKQITGPYELQNPEAPFPPAAEQFYPENPEVTQKYISNDASLFTDADGRHFIFWSCHHGIWEAEIELPSCRMIGEKWLAIPASKNGWHTTIEGPVLFQHGRWIYLAQASGVYFIDLTQIIADRYDELGQEKVQPLFCNTSDHVHTSPAGSELNAACVAAGLNPVKNFLPAKFLLP